MTYEPQNGLTQKVDKYFRNFKNTRPIKFKLERPLISFTFDDFPASAIDNGAHVLEAAGWAGTFYTCAGLERTQNHHGLHFAAKDLPALEAKGHEIAGHTYDHQDCSLMSEGEIVIQIEHNRAALQRMGVTGDLSGFAYPYGATNSHLKPLMAKNYHAVRGIQNGVHYKSADLNELRSNGLYSSTFERIMSDIATLKLRPGWMTLFTHDIVANPTAWGCTPAQFKTVVKAVQDINAIVLPVRDSVAYLETYHA